MRLLLTVLIVAFIGGGTWAYVEFDNRIDRSASNVVFAEVDGKVSVEIRRTFDCYGDPDFEEDAIRVTYVNEIVYRSDEAKIPASETIAFDFKGSEVERNSLTVFANSLSPDAGFSDTEPALVAMQVIVSYDGHVIADTVFHGDGSEILIGGSVDFVIPRNASEDHLNH